jgi:hypothetical protein
MPLATWSTKTSRCHLFINVQLCTSCIIVCHWCQCSSWCVVMKCVIIINGLSEHIFAIGVILCYISYCFCVIGLFVLLTSLCIHIREYKWQHCYSNAWHIGCSVNCKKNHLTTLMCNTSSTLSGNVVISSNNCLVVCLIQPKWYIKLLVIIWDNRNYNVVL